jgi:SpoVK/Ycf46/Vps4 family AAA+-type ATPase
MELESLMQSGTLRVTGRELRVFITEMFAQAHPVPRYTVVHGLAAALHLSPAETRVLGFCSAYEHWSELVEAVSEFGLDQLAEVVAAATRCTVDEAQQAIGVSGSMVTAGLIDLSHLEHRPSRARILTSHTRQYLAGQGQRSITDIVCEPITPPVLSVSAFPVAPESTSILQSLLGAPDGANLLLVGPPGVGKSEYARALCASAGRQAVRPRRLPDDDLSKLRPQLHSIVRLLSREHVLIVDEADAVLSSGASLFGAFLGGSEKGWINNLVDSHSRTVIWIVNSAERIDPSTRRRFDYSVAFRDPEPHERELQWQHLLSRHQVSDLMEPEDISQFARAYEVGPGAIDRCVRAAAQVGSSFVSVLPQVLERHISLTRRGRKIATGHEQTFDPSLSKADVDLRETTRVLGELHQMRRSQPRMSRDQGTTLLLSGPPGTGKTAYASYLAIELSVPLISRRASDLLSPYLGVTEKNVAAAFSEAEERDGILLIDEADSFLRSRESAHRSWEVTQVNEFLTQMESFRGTLICCTNYVRSLDSASLRRFSWKITFSPPDATGRRALFQRYFSAPLDEPAASALDRLDGLVPADFALVVRRRRLTSSSGARQIVTDLAAELDSRDRRGRVIGFTGAG